MGRGMRMDRMVTMTESTARFTLTAACGLSIFAAGAAMFLRVREMQVGSLIFLLLAVVFSTVTLVAYRRYNVLRRARWQTELKRSEDEMSQVLNHARLGVIIDHVTGPLGPDAAKSTTPLPQSNARGDNEVAQPKNP
jgi:hypothetical protein